MSEPPRLMRWWLVTTFSSGFGGSQRGASASPFFSSRLSRERSGRWATAVRGRSRARNSATERGLARMGGGVSQRPLLRRLRKAPHRHLGKRLLPRQERRGLAQQLAVEVLEDDRAR